MKSDSYFFNCSQQYLDSVFPRLHDEIIEVIHSLPKRLTQAEINTDLFWILTARGWAYDSRPSGVSLRPPDDLGIKDVSLEQLGSLNQRQLCLTSTTIEARWHSDFGKLFGNALVQVEVQFGKVESMFKDFCGFKIAWYERRLSLGVEIVMSDPAGYFAHRKNATSGMAYFDIAKKTLPAIGLGCPIWLIGVAE
jgi:hypothetical protein